MKTVIWTLLHRKQQFTGGMLISNVAALIQMNARVGHDEVTPKNIKQVLKIVKDDRKLTVRGIADMVNVSTGSTFTILHDKLGMKNAPLAHVNENNGQIGSLVSVCSSSHRTH